MAESGPSSAQVGSINVGITGDNTGLQSKLAQSEAQVKASAAKMNAAMAAPVGNKSAAAGGTGGHRIFPAGSTPGSNPFLRQAEEDGKRAGKSWLDGFKKGTRDFRLVMGGFGLVGAAVAAQRMFSIGQKIGDAFFNANARAREFSETLNSIRASHVEATVAAVVNLRKEMGAVGSAEAERLKTLSLIRQEEAKLNEEYLNQIRHFDSLAGLWEGINRRMTRGQLTAEAEADRLRVLKSITNELQAQMRINISILEAREEQERIEKRMREQAKRDITHTAIDVSRFGPALDLLQRQRTGN